MNDKKFFYDISKIDREAFIFIRKEIIEFYKGTRIFEFSFIKRKRILIRISFDLNSIMFLRFGDRKEDSFLLYIASGRFRCPAVFSFYITSDTFMNGSVFFWEIIIIAIVFKKVF